MAFADGGENGGEDGETLLITNQNPDILSGIWAGLSEINGISNSGIRN
jgi:hypothetical protein